MRCSLVIRAYNEEEHIGRLLERSLASIFWFRWNQFRGTYPGYRHASALTPELRQTFYYRVGWEKTESRRRELEPIRYNE
jgi:hypothetical protein